MEYGTFLYGTGVAYDAIGAVYDRSEEDIKNRTDKAFASYVDWNRIEGNTKAIADYLNTLGYAFRLKYKLDWDATSFPSLEEQARILNNLRYIISEYHTASGQLPSSMEPLDYTKLNMLEYAQAYIRYLMDQMATYRRYSGYVRAGGGYGL